MLGHSTSLQIPQLRQGSPVKADKPKAEEGSLVPPALQAGLLALDRDRAARQNQPQLPVSQSQCNFGQYSFVQSSQNFTNMDFNATAPVTTFPDPFNYGVNYQTQQGFYDVAANPEFNSSIDTGALYTGPLMGPASDHYSDANTVQAKIAGLCQEVQSRHEIPQAIQQHILEDLRSIGSQQTMRERQLQNERDVVHRERDNVRAVIQDNQRLLTNALAERDRACRERDESALVTQRNLMNKRSFERLQQVERNLKNLNAELQAKVAEQAETIRTQEEQLAGKRTLWMENHPSSSVRRGTQERDPYSTPSAAQSQPRISVRAIANEGSVQNLNRQFKDMAGSSQVTALVNTLPTGRARPAPYVGPQANTTSTGYHHAATGHSSPGGVAAPAMASMSLVPYLSEDDVAARFTEETTKLWTVIEIMCTTYYGRQNSPRQISRIQNVPFSWNFILGLTYPDVQDAHTHTTMLLQDPEHRRFLCMRIATEYITKTMWDIMDFCEYSPSCGRKIKDVVDHLKTRGLSTAGRAEAMSVATSLIQQIVDSDNYLSYRGHKLSEHTKALRTLLGPVLNNGIDRAPPGRDIAMLVVEAFDLAGKMHTSNWAFSFHFPPCSSKFIESGMECKNLGEGETPMNLQLRQARIKLSMTPVITMRDDRGVAIRVKQLAPAYVLCMK